MSSRSGTTAVSGEDKIQLDHLVFDKLGAAGALNAEYFIECKAAVDANDYLRYDKATLVVGDLVVI